jgi:hypothetical protein
MAEIPEFAPGTRPPGPDCADTQIWGIPSTLYSYIGKLNNGFTEEEYPPEACKPRYHSNAKIDNILVTANTTTGTLSTGAITGTTAIFSGLVTAGSFSANSKTFNISHPSPDKQGTRLVHGCLEGPEHAVYVRGRVRNTTEIILPDYWKDLVDKKTITVNLTPIGAHQDVIVKGWSLESIQLQSKGGMPIDCFYTVHGERKDIPSLVVEQDEVVD